MREIKFKIWDVDRKTMFYDVLRLTENGIEKWVSLEKRTSENVLWLQYTGLKDKNGVEIYEGDIVEDVNCNLFLVRYNEFCSFMLYTISNEDKFMAIYPTITLRIFGNIHSNPELLK